MMFDIHFDIDGPNDRSAVTIEASVPRCFPERSVFGGETEAIEYSGAITLQSFQERFRSPAGFWTKLDYERQWHSALDRILAGAPKTALITAMYDPAYANFLSWWPLYRAGNTIFVQNHLLFMIDLPQGFDLRDIDRFVPKHLVVDEDGQNISTWAVSASDIEEFQERTKL